MPAFLYILDAMDRPCHATSFASWGRWMAEDGGGRRFVADELIRGIRVSTVFTGIDHAWGNGGPLVWETMVFGGVLDLWQQRCTGTREQAEAMHAEVVEIVRMIECVHPEAKT